MDRPLFKTFPLDDKVILDGEIETSPYHIYDGNMLMLGGHADGKAVADLLKPEGWWSIFLLFQRLDLILQSPVLLLQ